MIKSFSLQPVLVFLTLFASSAYAQKETSVINMVFTSDEHYGKSAVFIPSGCLVGRKNKFKPLRSIGTPGENAKVRFTANQ